MRTLVLPQDSEGFVRRECPHCHRQFKTRPLPGDALTVLRRLGAAMPHENPHELEAGPARACLICGRVAPADSWLTPEQQEQLGTAAGAWAQEVRRLQARCLGAASDRPPRAPPELPGLGPEADDLHPVLLLCCGEEAKAPDDWRGAVYCPRCGARQHTGRSELTLEVIRE